MTNYVIGADGVNREIPGVYEESFSNVVTDPSRVADGGMAYDFDFGSTQEVTIITRPLTNSNRTFNELYGYLKGRGWVSERVYLERNGGEIQAYIRIEEVTSDFRGRVKNKRTMSIKIIQKY